MRLNEFQRILKKKGFGAALFVNTLEKPSSNFLYLSGSPAQGILFVTPSSSVLLVHEMDYLIAKKYSRIRNIRRSSDMLGSLKRLLSSKRVVGLDFDSVTVNSLSRLKRLHKARYVDVSGILSDLRQVKTPEEVRLLAKACRITDDIFHKVFLNLKRFGSESEIAAFILDQTYRLGLEPAFSPIVASGPNASKAHHIPDDKPLRKGFCVIDYGVRYKGLSADMTRTFFIGSPSDRDLELYYLVLRSQQESLKLARPGTSFFDIDVFSKKLLGSYSKFMNHSVGHGVGFDCHERPFVRRTKKGSGVLSVGSAMTVEPGIYFPGKLGIRIEDTLLVTEKGPRLLTRTGKNLLVIRK